MLTTRLRSVYERAADARRDRNAPGNRLFAAALHKEMAFERAFVGAGGKLLAGADPTGWGGVMAGFADQREVELLTEAGFAPEKAIQIATSNGARFLYERDLGTIAPGMRADLIVLDGDPVKNIADIRKVETVFKGGPRLRSRHLDCRRSRPRRLRSAHVLMELLAGIAALVLLPVVLVRRIANSVTRRRDRD